MTFRNAVRNEEAEVEPRTLFEKADQTESGSRVQVRAAEFHVGEEVRGGIVLTVRVPADWGDINPDDGSVTASLLLDPSEGLAIADWMREAFRAADGIGPGLYSEAIESATDATR